MTWLVAVATLLLCPLAAIRWLRVAQREHYHAKSVTRFADRWWTSSPVNTVLFTVMMLAALAWLVLVFLTDAAAIAGAVAGVIALVGPIGLGLKGRTAKLSWTRRMKTTAAVVGALDVLGAAVLRNPVLLAAQPLVVDLALAVTGPFERKAGRKWVDSATAKLRSVDPITVAITGSFGKTSTKQYLRHLITGTRSVLASPASFNNTNGLARTLNEQLNPGTEIFIAEMGTYGPGEIASMCTWVQPDVAALINIGPVHLERMKSLDGIVNAKSEIFATARHAVLNVDAHGLAAVADRLEADGKRVLRASTSDDMSLAVDVRVRRSDRAVFVHGLQVATLPDGPQPDNVACAIALALAVDIPVDRIAARLGDLPVPEHRQEVATSGTGVVVLDNTFSSNPASAAASLEKLTTLATKGRRVVVVTPGMVELGKLQFAENQKFGAAAATVATDLVVVGRTNRAALLAGATRKRTRVHCVGTRDEAVAWVRSTLAAGDVVLYENDLPDHFA
ncbi:MAG: Mur ligase family protein [Acidimicrobiia bacterium]